MRRGLLLVLLLGLVALVGCVVDEAGELETKIYGRFKADVALDSDQTNSNGNFVQWVDPDVADEGDQLAITARETRIGVTFKQGEGLSGKAEVDFYGGAVTDIATGDVSEPAENKPTVLLRHLYAKMGLDNGMSLLAGQTSDVFSPLLPAVLNYGWGWNCGNTGYRRPQVRFEYANQGFLVQLAAARSIAEESSGQPDLQGRLAYGMQEIPVPFTVGVSAVSGVTDVDGDVDLSGFAVDFEVKLHDRIQLRGEYFTGENLSTYLGGIGQGVIGGEELETSGGWVQLGIKATEEFSINLGYCFDDPDDEEMTGGERDENTCIFANLRYMLNDKTELGLEVSKWTTDYNGDDEYDNTRVQMSLIVNF